MFSTVGFQFKIQWVSLQLIWILFIFDFLQVDGTEAEKKTDTDNNMAVMFDILRRNKRVKVENLVLNRRSFAQTVENLFALSFLVKDGRVEIVVEKNGSHFAGKII